MKVDRTPLAFAVMFSVGTLPAVLLADFENVALRGIATQSSGYNGDQFPATNGINGNINDFTHTNSNDNDSSWQVQLDDIYAISAIVIYNRGGGCCQSRLRDLTVFVFDSSVDPDVPQYTSPLLNAENVMSGGTTSGPKIISLDLVAITGGPLNGDLVRVHRTVDPDNSGTGGVGNLDEDNVLQMGEVEVMVGDCPEQIATCSGLTVNGPANGGPGLYEVTAAGTGAPVYYSFEADNKKDPPLRFGLQVEDTIAFPLTPGTWTITVRVADIPYCPNPDPAAVCTQDISVLECSADPPDTTCQDFVVEPPHGGNFPGLYTATATAVDGSGDPVFFTFTADNGVDPPLVAGPRDIGAATFRLGVGKWKVTAGVGDSRFCPPDGTCTQEFDVEPVSANPNVAPAGFATQSSGFNGDQFPAALGNNGSLDDFTHTSSADDMASWEVDLGDNYAIDAVVLHNRGNCCASRLRDITITILDLEGKAAWTSELLNEENALGLGTITAGPPSLTVSLLAEPGKAVDGRSVRVSRTADPDNSGIGGAGTPDDSNVLSLGEVEVYGAPVVLAARATRDISNQTIGAGEAVDVSVVVAADAPVDVVVREIIPERMTAKDISLGGALNAGAIEWSLTGVTTQTVGYKLESAVPCAGTFTYGFSTIAVGGRKARIGGDTFLERELLNQKLDGWQSTDIGVTTGGGTESLGSHEALVTSSGQGIKLNADDFRLVSVAQSGDFVFTARIDCVDDPVGKGQAGVMVRDTLDPFSCFVALYLSPPAAGQAGVGVLNGRFRRDTNTNRNMGPITVSQKDVDSLPIYLRLQRTGALITLSRSPDGITFTDVATKEIGTGTTQANLRSETLVGLASSSGSGVPVLPVRHIFGAVSGPEFNPIPIDDQPKFRRGEANVDGTLDLTDPITVLNFQFQGGPRPGCMDAADADDSGTLDLTDAIYSLNFQFLAGPPPPPPGPNLCGPDLTPDDLDCVRSCP